MKKSFKILNVITALIIIKSTVSMKIPFMIQKAHGERSTITFQWEHPVPLYDTDRYRLFWKDNKGSGVHTSPFIERDVYCINDVLPQSICECDYTDPGFTPGSITVFWIRAYDSEGFSSDPSNMVSLDYFGQGNIRIREDCSKEPVYPEDFKRFCPSKEDQHMSEKNAIPSGHISGGGGGCFIGSTLH